MRIKTLFISTIMGAAVVSGIIKSLTYVRIGEKKEKGKKAGAGQGKIPMK